MTYLRIVEGEKGESQPVMGVGVESLLKKSEELEQSGQGKICDRPGYLQGKRIPNSIQFIA